MTKIISILSVLTLSTAILASSIEETTTNNLQVRSAAKPFKAVKLAKAATGKSKTGKSKKYTKKAAVNWAKRHMKAKKTIVKHKVHAKRIKKHGVSKRKVVKRSLAKVVKKVEHLTSKPSSGSVAGSAAVPVKVSKAKKVAHIIKTTIQKAISRKPVTAQKAVIAKPVAAKDVTLVRGAPPVSQKVPAVSKSKTKKRSAKVAMIAEVDGFGTTYEFYGKVAVGTPAQNLPTIFDTGSSDNWWSAPGINTAGAGGYNNVSSNTWVKDMSSLDNELSIQYGIGAVSGTLGTDIVSVGGLVVQNQIISSVDVVTSDIAEDGAAGLLGLGFAALSFGGKPTFMENLVAAGGLKLNLFAVHFERSSVSGSELALGSLNSRMYMGPITYTPVTKETYWNVMQTSVFVNNVETVIPTVVAIDTGSTDIMYPRKLVAAMFKGTSVVKDLLNSVVDKETPSNSVDYYKFLCTDPPAIALTFASSSTQRFIDFSDINSGTISNDPNELYCSCSIQGQNNEDENGDYFGIVGDALLKGYYTVFNFGQSNEGSSVGFAVRA